MPPELPVFFEEACARTRLRQRCENNAAGRGGAVEIAGVRSETGETQ